jgi:hypothetical protein
VILSILPILVDFLLSKIIFERVGGTTFLADRVGGGGAKF